MEESKPRHGKRTLLDISLATCPAVSHYCSLFPFSSSHFRSLVCSKYSTLPHTSSSIQALSSLPPSLPPPPALLRWPKHYLITKAFPDDTREKLIAPTPCHTISEQWTHVHSQPNADSTCLTSPKGHEHLGRQKAHLWDLASFHCPSLALNKMLLTCK